MNPTRYLWLADLVLLLHWGVVLFVVGGWAAIWVGNRRNWRWVNRWPFRVGHLLTLSTVILQAWLGALCPLTRLESWLREQGGQTGYPSTFLQHWTHRFLYYEAPSWVFAAVYTAFGALVLWTWWRFPPERRRPNAPPPPARTARRSQRPPPCARR